MPHDPGPRISWPDLPITVRTEIEAILGDRVVDVHPQTGGFSPGTADRLVTTTSRRAFVKAVSPDQNPDSPAIHRREASIASRLPSHPAVPALLGSYDDGRWVALVLEDVEGAHPSTPWVADELTAVLDTLADLARALTPSPLDDLPIAADDLVEELGGWARLLHDPEPHLDPWCAQRLPMLAERAGRGPAALVGDCVVHTDIRADNLLIRPDGGVSVVDWPWACRGPAWLDTLMLLVNVNLYGGHDVEGLVQSYLPDVAAETVTDLLIGFAGYFLEMARRPEPPGLPTLRGFQRQQGEATLAWVKARVATP